MMDSRARVLRRLITLFSVALLVLVMSSLGLSAAQDSLPTPDEINTSTPDVDGAPGTPGAELTPEGTSEPELTPGETPPPELTPEETAPPELTPDETPSPELTPDETSSPELTPDETPAPETTPGREGTPEAQDTLEPESTLVMEGTSETPESEQATPVPTETPVIPFVQEILTRQAPVSEPSDEGPELPQLTLEEWLGLAASTLIVVLAAIFGNRVLYGLLRQLVKRTPTTLDEALLETLRPLIVWWLVAIGFDIAVRGLGIQNEATRELLRAINFLLYLPIGVVSAWRLLDSAIDWYLAQIPPETETPGLDTVLPLGRRLVHLLILLVGLGTLLSYFDVNMALLATLLGVGVLAVSLAAQDTLADIIAGMTILVDRPFRIGDRIEIQSLKTWGDVVDIGLRTTRIQTRDNRMVIVPNASIAKSQVINYTYPDPRYRVESQVRLAHGTDIETASHVIVDTVRQVEGVLSDKPVEAIYDEMGPSAMIFQVRWWIESYADTRRMFDRVNTALQRAFDETGIKVPYPTSHLHIQIDGGAGERPSRPGGQREKDVPAAR